MVGARRWVRLGHEKVPSFDPGRPDPVEARSTKTVDNFTHRILGLLPWEDAAPLGRGQGRSGPEAMQADPVVGALRS